MLKALNLKHIFYFWIVAKKKSIKTSSTVINVSQSSISEQIKTLESNLGIVLFDRTQRKMSLSSNGKLLYKTLDKFFPAIEEIIESLVNHKSADVKFLRIGLCPTLSADLNFRLCYPFIEDIRFTVKALQGVNQFLCEAYDHDEIDMFFTTNSNISLRGKYEKKELISKSFSIVTNKSVYNKLPKTNKIKALHDINFINYTPDSELHFKIIDFFHEHKISPIRIAEIDDINLTKKTLLKLNSFAILPTSTVSEELSKGKLIEIGRPIKSLESKIVAYFKPSFKTDAFYENLNRI